MMSGRVWPSFSGLPAAQFGDPLRHAVERLAHRLGKIVSRCRQRYASAAPLKQRDSQVAFQRPHLMADRAVGDEQLVGGAREALVAGGGFERLDRVQRR